LGSGFFWGFFYEVYEEDEEQKREEEKYLLDDGSPLYLVDIQILPLHFEQKDQAFRLKQINGEYYCA
jgi:hypothetical protein